jgi:hypothetical protein
LVTALQNGANGFLFSVAETSLAVLRRASRRPDCLPFSLYAILPYSYEYVRLAVSRGGIPGLAREVAQQLLASRNVPAVLAGVKGTAAADPVALCEAYVRYDANRVRKAMGPRTSFAGVLLHEIVADMALGLGWDWLFRAFVQAGTRIGVRPGFNTRNLPLLVTKLREWGIPTRGLVFAAPFNAIGFQMCPSREAYEATLAGLTDAFVIGYGLLAAGYLQPAEAVAYAATLPNLRGVALGVSRVEHAQQVFKPFATGQPTPQP